MHAYGDDWAPHKGALLTALAYLAGSTNPCPIAVHMEPFTTSIQTVFVCEPVFATNTTKIDICTARKARPGGDCAALLCLVTFVASLDR
jgi:hypothetical protein